MSVDVAIVGVAGRFPGALGTGEYWANLAAGTDSITHFTDAELTAAGLPEGVRTHPDFVPAEPRVPELTMIDAPLFGLTPREARYADPQLRLFLESCHAALENAGYDPFAAPGRVAVFGATGTPIYLFEHLMQVREPSNQGQLAMLNNGDYFATQVSYRLNLTGPAMTVLSACSSSLLATHLAVRSLTAGECDMALAGGGAVELDARFGYFYASGSVRSRDGRCRPFDASGGGTVFGGGAGAVVLKRLGDAVADHDHVLAVIRGTAINNDGSAKESYGAPSVSGQVVCIREAMTTAGVQPGQLSYVEAHATGTSVGDPIEIAALEQAWLRLAAGEPAERCLIGSVKGNIGHIAQGAGVASLIKLAMTFDRALIPPSINVSTPLARMLEDDCPLRVATEAVPWPRDPQRPRWAAISSFGAGGTNVHMVLGDGPAAVATPPTGRERVLLWSAQSEAAADALTPVLAGHLTTTSAYEDAVSTLQAGRTPFRVRRAAVLAGPGDVGRALPSGDPAPLTGKVAPGGLMLTFAFPGQGTLTPGAGHSLCASEPRFAAHLASAFGLFGPRGRQFEELWRTCTDAAELADTGNAQPILFALEWALAQTWRAWGVVPSQVVGHSLGEIVAATVAGVFIPEDAATAVLARADAMRRMPPGAMVAVFAPEDTVREQLRDELDIAAVNGEREITVSGPKDAVAALIQRLRGQSVRVVPLRTSHAFHSRSMQAARDEMLEVFAAIQLSAPSLSLLSAAAGRVVDDEARDPRFWADQLIQPVRFRDAVTTLAAHEGSEKRRPGRLVVELGPGQALTGLINGHSHAREAAVDAIALFAARRAGEPPRERREVLTALATAWTRGAHVDWAAVDPDVPVRRVPVPGYQYQRQHFWVDSPLWAAGYPASRAPGDQAEAGAAAAAAAPEEPAAEVPPYSVLGWFDAARPEPAPDRVGCVAVLLPADRAAARRLLVALQRIAANVIAVRPGAGYELRERAAVLDPGDERQLSRLLDDLRDRGQVPDLAVHATGFGRWEAVTGETVDGQLRTGLGSLLRFAQVLARQSRPARLAVITSRAVDVSGSEALDPVKSAALGLVRSWPREDPSVAVRLIDADERTGEEDLADELSVVAAASVVALRGARRWVPAEIPFDPLPAHSRLLRRKGVYLVTGGTGALGRELVLGLARTGLQPSIALLSRSGPAAGQLAEIIEEAEDLGCRVKVIAGNVSDARDVRRAVDIVTAQFGTLSGVFHLAGIAGDGIVAMRDLAAADSVLAPKIRGTVVLHEVLRDRTPLDFWISYSSRAAMTGLAGSADYAGANAFLDAWTGAAAGASPDTRLLSIGWPSWSEVGMAAAELAAEAAAADGERTYREWLDPGAAWFLNEHRFDGTPVLPGAGHVDLVIRGFRSVIGPAEAPVQLREVVFASAFDVLEPVDCVVTFVPDQDSWRFRLQARGTTYSSGWIQPLEDGGIRRRVKLDLLRDSLPPGSPSNRDAQIRAFALGPRWKCVDAESTEGERSLVDLRIDPAFEADLAEHPMHPALLDWATSSARLADAGGYLPFMYGSLVLHENLPGRFVSSIRRTRHTDEIIMADIDLVSPDGLVFAEIKDFTMRAFDRSTFVARTGPGKQPTPQARSGSTRRGITPKTGVDLLMRLLDSRTPPHVAVRPFTDGRPEPLDVTGRVRPEPVASQAPVAEPPAPAGTAASPAPAPGDALERMRRVWTEVLGLVDLAPDDDFFDVGGTSLSAIDMVSRIREEFGTEVSIATLLDAPTLGGLATAVAGGPTG